MLRASSLGLKQSLPTIHAPPNTFSCGLRWASQVLIRTRSWSNLAARRPVIAPNWDQPTTREAANKSAGERGGAGSVRRVGSGNGAGRERKKRALTLRVSQQPSPERFISTPTLARSKGNAISLFTSIQHDAPPHLTARVEHGLESEAAKVGNDGASCPHALVDLNSCEACIRLLLTTKDVEVAWDAYIALVSLSQDGPHPIVPFPPLHRLTRLISETHPRTRVFYLRLLSVMTHLYKLDGDLMLWQWNALIDFAGRGLRKGRPADFYAALDIYHDMISGRLPGASLSDGEEHDYSAPLSCTHEPHVPDIVTYTTLLHIAARTLDDSCVRHAISLLRSSKLSPNRITHLSLLKYFTPLGDISGVRATLAKLREQGHELEIDGLNAAMWAFARNGRLDITLNIYRNLRNAPSLALQKQEEEDITLNETEQTQYLTESENIVIPHGMVPDEITYTIMIQTLAYQGDLLQALQVFHDMLSAPKNGPTLPDSLIASAFSSDSDGTRIESNPPNYLPTMAAFRALFIGFIRHTANSKTWKSGYNKPLTERLKRARDNTSHWNLDTLRALFADFMAMDHPRRPSDRTVYWIMVAFSNTSQQDRVLLRDTWTQLMEKFGDGGWSRRLQQIGHNLRRN